MGTCRRRPRPPCPGAQSLPRPLPPLIFTRVSMYMSSSARSSPPNLYSLERRHNFETHNRPQVANRKPQPSEWTRVFPFIRHVV